MDLVAGEAWNFHYQRSLVTGRHVRRSILGLIQARDAELWIGNVNRSVRRDLRLRQPQEQRADVPKPQACRRFKHMLGKLITEELHQQCKRKRRNYSRVGIDVRLRGEVDTTNAASMALESDNLVPGMQQALRQACRKSAGNLPVSVARVEKTPIEMSGLPFWKEDFEKQRGQGHALQTAGGDIGRELIRGHAPDLFRVVE